MVYFTNPIPWMSNITSFSKQQIGILWGLIILNYAQSSWDYWTKFSILSLWKLVSSLDSYLSAKECPGNMLSLSSPGTESGTRGIKKKKKKQLLRAWCQVVSMTFRNYLTPDRFQASFFYSTQINAL